MTYGRPTMRLLRVPSVDSELGRHVNRVCAWSSELKITIPFAPAMENVHTPFVFDFMNPEGTYGQKDGRAIRVMQHYRTTV